MRLSRNQRRERTFMKSKLTLSLTAFLFGLMLILAPASSGWAQSADNLADSEITHAVDLDLMFSDLVAAHMIDVETHEGIVTLSGTVDNMVVRDYAVEIAESVKGVRAVVNRIEVKPILRTDQEIRDDVLQALANDPASDSYEIDVTVDKGTVTLSGSVDSWAEKRLTEKVVKGVKGVKEIANRIDITYTENRPDYEMENEINRRMELNPYINEALIGVKVENGEAIFTGTVGSSAEKSHIRQEAWVYGVTAIDLEQVEVDPMMDDTMQRESDAVVRSDQQIKEAITDALRYDPRTVSFNYEVEVENGSVSLYGTVDNLKAKNAAGMNARNTMGVWQVNNFVDVRPINPPSADVIAENIRSALMWDPIVERHEINVEVRNNKAFLEGQVDSFYEKLHATDVASRVFGVADVQNTITVNLDETWKSDMAIKEDVEDELFWNIFVDSDAVNVSVDNGIVTLSGVVDNWNEYTAAVENAFEGGATSVWSEMQVEDVQMNSQPEYFDHRPDYYWLY